MYELNSSTKRKYIFIIIIMKNLNKLVKGHKICELKYNGFKKHLDVCNINVSSSTNLKINRTVDKNMFHRKKVHHSRNILV